MLTHATLSLLTPKEDFTITNMQRNSGMPITIGVSKQNSVVAYNVTLENTLEYWNQSLLENACTLALTICDLRETGS